MCPYVTKGRTTRIYFVAYLCIYVYTNQANSSSTLHLFLFQNVNDPAFAEFFDENPRLKDFHPVNLQTIRFLLAASHSATITHANGSPEDADPNWAKTLFTIPWFLYPHTGDKTVLRKHLRRLPEPEDRENSPEPAQEVHYVEWLACEGSNKTLRRNIRAMSGHRPRRSDRQSARRKADAEA
jgi:hypothetical protein